MMHKKQHNKPNQPGFTIIELMIATVVFSVVLLLITNGIIMIGNRYYKASLDSKTQQVSRNIIDEVSRNIQFGVAPKTADGIVCANGTLYSYELNVAYVGVVSHKLTANASDCVGVLTTNFNGRDMLSDRMRLAKLSVIPSGTDSYTVTVKVISGEDDLLCIPNGGNCGAYSAADPNVSAAKCKTGAGKQFCSVSELTTTVQPRIGG